LARPLKIVSKCATNEDHKYIMCKHAQEPSDGKVITTKFDMDLCDDLDEFLNVLHINNEISETEKDEIMTVYYYTDERYKNHH